MSISFSASREQHVALVLEVGSESRLSIVLSPEMWIRRFFANSSLDTFRAPSMNGIYLNLDIGLACVVKIVFSFVRRDLSHFSLPHLS